MKKILILLSLSSFLWATTIKQSVESSLKHTHRLKIENINLKIKKRYVQKAKSNNRPTLNLNLYKLKEKTEFIGKKDAIYDSTNYSLSLNQNLYNGGYDTNNIKMSKIDVEIEKIEYKRVTQTLIYKAINTHLELLLSKRLLALQKRLLNQYNSILEIIKKKSKYGDESALIDIQSRIYNQKLKYQQLKEDYNYKVGKYISIIGRKPKNLKSYIKIQKRYIKNPSKLNLTLSNQNIIKNILEIEKSEYKIKRERAKFLPKVDLQLQAYKSEPLAQLGVITQNQYSVKLNLNYNLYNGNRDRLDREISRLERLKLIEQKEELKREVYLKYLYFYESYKYSIKNKKILYRYIKNENIKYNKDKKIFKLSEKKSLLDIVSSLDKLYIAKSLLLENINSNIKNYISLIFLQSKLTLDNI